MKSFLSANLQRLHGEIVLLKIIPWGKNLPLEKKIHPFIVEHLKHYLI
jgi:hypothetical protein